MLCVAAHSSGARSRVRTRSVARRGADGLAQVCGAVAAVTPPERLAEVKRGRRPLPGQVLLRADLQRGAVSSDRRVDVLGQIAGAPLEKGGAEVGHGARPAVGVVLARVDLQRLFERGDGLALVGGAVAERAGAERRREVVERASALVGVAVGRVDAQRLAVGGDGVLKVVGPPAADAPAVEDAEAVERGGQALGLLGGAAVAHHVVDERDGALELVGLVGGEPQAEGVAERQLRGASLARVEALLERLLELGDRTLEVLGAVAGAAVKEHGRQVEPYGGPGLVVVGVQQAQRLLVAGDGMLDVRAACVAGLAGVDVGEVAERDRAVVGRLGGGADLQRGVERGNRPGSVVAAVAVEALVQGDAERVLRARPLRRFALAIAERQRLAQVVDGAVAIGGDVAMEAAAVRDAQVVQDGPASGLRLAWQEL
jgi:hypothetical protein